MKKFLSILIVICGLISCENLPQNSEVAEISSNKNKIESKEKLTVEVENAWVREYPTDGKVIAKLNIGTECIVLKKDKKETIKGKSDYWYKIKFDDKEGWIFGSQTSQKEKQKNRKITQYQMKFQLIKI